MSNYLSGDFTDCATSYKDCYIFISDFASETDSAFYTLIVTAYQDIAQTTKLYQRSDILLSIGSTSETEDNKEIRALRQFKMMFAPGMELITGTASSTNATTSAVTDSSSATAATNSTGTASNATAATTDSSDTSTSNATSS